MSSAADTWPYSAREAAALLGVSERTIRRAIARGELAATKHAGIFRIAPDVLDDYRDRRRLALPPRPRGGAPKPVALPAANTEPKLLRFDQWAGRSLLGLPKALTSFLGRNQETAEVIAALSKDDVRLLCLTGPGGVGKTRLALQVAQEMAPRFADGVAFVPLAAVTEATFVPSEVGKAFSVRANGDRPSGERVAAILRDRQALLVLDNFEHLLPAATFVAELLASCHSLTILVTSRTMLGVSGEHRFPVPPLTVPHPALVTIAQDILQADAVQLFVTRAQSVQPDFTLLAENAGDVAAICRHLDGLPLAIELAAARLPVLPPHLLLARLERRLPLLTDGPRDVPFRLQTMRAAITWSYDLLSASEQALFRRLAVFTGGCSLEGAAAVAGSDQDALAGISSLVASSLLRHEARPSGESRYVMLETIREFGLERLAQAEEELETRQRHAAYCLAMSERGYPNHFGPYTGIDQRLLQLEDELPNLRAALDFLTSTADAEGVLRLAGALALFWQLRGHLREGRQWLESALADTADVQTDARSRALLGLGSLCAHQGDQIVAESLVRRALAIADAINAQELAAHAIHLLGFIAINVQSWEEAEALFTDALAAWRELDAWAEEAVTLMHLSGIALHRGQHDLSTRRAEASLMRCRDLGYASGAGLALCRLGQLARQRGDNHGAALAFREALDLWSAQDDHYYIMLALAGLAEIASSRGQAHAAATLVGAIDTLVYKAGAALFASARANRDRAASMARAALGGERCDELYTAGQRMQLVEVVALAAAIPVPDTAAESPLTARQTEIVRHIASGRTDQEIAAMLFISHRTVNAHVAHILSRLQVRTRHEATRRARDLGLLPRDEGARYT